MIIKLVISLLLIIIGAIVFNSTYYYIRSRERNNQLNLSFENSLSKIGLPIVTFCNNGNELHFLVDSGATNSMIDERILNYINFNKTEECGTIYGIDNKVIPVNYADIKLYIYNVEFEDTFRIMKLESMDSLSREYGFRIVGILGNSFLYKYGMHIKFKNMELSAKLRFE